MGKQKIPADKKQVGQDKSDSTKSRSSFYLKSKYKTRQNKLYNFFHYLFSFKVESKVFVFGILFLAIAFSLFYIKIYPDLYSLDELYAINHENRFTDIEPKDEIKIKFARPINKQLAEENFSIKPDVEGNISWEDEISLKYAQTFIFKPSEYFTPGTQYNIKFDEIKTFFGATKENILYSFQTLNYPYVGNITPEPGSENNSINSEIEVTVNNESPYFYLLFELLPKTDIDIKYDADKSKFYIKPKDELSQGTEYKLKISKYFNPEPPVADNNILKEGGNHINSQEFEFKTIPPVLIEDVFPDEDSTNASQNTEIRISFDRQVKYKSAEENFSITPEAEGVIGWEEKTLVFQPEKLKPSAEYTVKMAKGVKSHNDEGFLDKDFEYKFKTKINPKEAVPSKAIIPQITEGKYIDIGLSEQILTMFEDSKNIGSFLASTGKYGMPTPIGRHKVLNKSEVAYSSKYNLYMPFWIQFTWAGHGIHELPFWKYRGGVEYKERESHLGMRVSHGCVRLGVGPAEELYNWADIGTPIIVHE